MLHCHDGKADCQDVLYIFSVRMSVSHAIRDQCGMAKLLRAMLNTIEVPIAELA